MDDFLSNELLVKCHASERHEVVFYALGTDKTSPAISIPRDVLDKMSFSEAARFLGERLILLSPVLREHFSDYLWLEDGARTHLCQKPLETRTSIHFRFFQQVEKHGESG